MTPPIGVVYVYRQERASCAAELRLLLKAMRSHALPIFFNSMTGVRSVADLRIGISPHKSRFENISREAVCYWREDTQRQMFNTSLGL